MVQAILGISAFYHDSAAVLIVDGEIIAAAQEERFTRKKHDSGFPSCAVEYVLQEGGMTLSDIEYVAFYDKPFLKFERLLETYHGFAPKGLRSFLISIPVWIKEKLFMRRMLNEELARFGLGKPKFLFPEHHLSHAASAFYPSPFNKAAILTIDGVGEWATTTICLGDGKDISVLRELTFPHSLGLLYSAFTHYCGFRVNSGEYKLMGLAPYGNPESEETQKFYRLICESLIDIRDDGSFLLNMDFFQFATGLTMTHDKRWASLFGLTKREPESDLDQRYMNLALAIQQVTEHVVLKLAKTARELTGCENLTLAGGVALNCVANGRILQENIFENVWIQPAAGDAGGALGAALVGWHIHHKVERKDPRGCDSIKGSYLGPRFSEHEVVSALRKYDASYEKFDVFGDLCQKVARLIDEGNAIGWFQGRMEYGPRALGNRSILGDPRNPEMQKKLNLKIKYRESFRPFAPSVLEEDIDQYFDLNGTSPYMLLVAPVEENRRNQTPDGYTEMNIRDRLYFIRSDVPAITHIDFSARVQSVNRDVNPAYWELINAFKDLTGYGILVNTSFNVRGEPIVCTPLDAYRCFMRTEMDYLVVGNFLFDKKQQPKWLEQTDWRESFVLD